MEKFTIISKGGVGEFSIMDSKNDFVTVFSYRNWFSSNGSAPTAEGSIEIKAKNNWESAFLIYLNGKEIGDIIFNWKGNIIITLDDRDGVRKNYLLTHPDDTSDWILEDDDNHIILKLSSHTHWSRVDYKYDVEVYSHANTSVVNLLISCGYATNLNMSMIAALKA